MKTLALVALLALAGCAKHGKAPLSDVWLPTSPGGLQVCLPAPPARLSKDESALWTRVSEAALRGDPAIAQGALDAYPGDLAPLGNPKPIVRLQRALSGLDPMPGYDPAADAAAVAAKAKAAPTDGCLQHSAGVYAMVARQPPLEFLDAAAVALPDSPHPVAARLMFEFQDQSVDEATLASAASRFPTSAPIHALQALTLLRAGRFADALPHLDVVQRAGVDNADLIFEVSRLAGDLDRYLRIASERGLPLGDGGSLASAENPESAYKALIGVDEDGDLPVRIDTNMGALSCELLWQEAPVTVANFVGLATGTQPFTDPATGQTATRPYYDGTPFHRVIPGFMIQGGDPTGTGSGGPGYRFLDETTPTRGFDKPGRLAMANSGAGTNGSQFFITEAPVTYLNGKHTIFGQCDDATLEVVAKIAGVARDAQDRPQEPILIEAIAIGSRGQDDRGER